MKMLWSPRSMYLDRTAWTAWFLRTTITTKPQFMTSRQETTCVISYAWYWRNLFFHFFNFTSFQNERCCVGSFEFTIIFLPISYWTQYKNWKKTRAPSISRLQTIEMSRKWIELVNTYVISKRNLIHRGLDRAQTLVQPFINSVCIYSGLL